MNVSFKASLVNYSTIIKRDPVNKHQNSYISSFVELDTQNNADYQALRKIALDWGKESSLVIDLFDNFTVDRHRIRHLYPTGLKNIKFKYFALLKDNKPPYNKINADSILGITSFVEETDNSYTIQQLQTHPDYIWSKQNRDFKHIGEAMLKSLIGLIQNKNIKVFPLDREAEAFYERFNFKKIPRSDFMKLKF